MKIKVLQSTQWTMLETIKVVASTTDGEMTITITMYQWRGTEMWRYEYIGSYNGLVDYQIHELAGPVSATTYDYLLEAMINHLIELHLATVPGVST